MQAACLHVAALPLRGSEDGCARCGAHDRRTLRHGANDRRTLWHGADRRRWHRTNHRCTLRRDPYYRPLLGIDRRAFHPWLKYRFRLGLVGRTCSWTPARHGWRDLYPIVFLGRIGWNRRCAARPTKRAPAIRMSALGRFCRKTLFRARARKIDSYVDAPDGQVPFWVMQCGGLL